MIKVIKAKTMKRFTSALAVAVYPNIYVREGWQYTGWLIEHEKVHLKEQKEKGVLRWLFRYAVDKNFRYWAEIRAYKISILLGLEVDKAARWMVNNYRLNVTKEQVIKDLTA